MTYVTDQTSAELRAHMKRLKAMAGWHEPLADRLWKEIGELDARITALEASQRTPGTIERCKMCERHAHPASACARTDCPIRAARTQPSQEKIP